MTAITVSFTSIADTAIDPNSPVTQGLMTAYRSRDQFLLEWLGASYQGGAVQDHDHDGVNSALIEVGPNLVRNGSFENNEAGWTFTDYSGGSHAQESANDMHGANSMAFTSTVLANGGGYAIASGFTPIGEDDVFSFAVYLKASTANVSARLEAVWYDDAQSQISSTNLVDLTNTPTSATRYVGDTAAPATARYFKLRATGGVPAAGSATGTIYFDGIRFSEFPFGTDDGFVTQSRLKSTTGEVSGTGIFTLPGGQYGFYPETKAGTGGSGQQAHIVETLSSTSYATRIYLTATAGVGSARQRYIQASPPYDLGSGEIELFMFASVDAGGNVLSTYVAPDPPWANNGPTDVRAQRYLNGKGYQRRRRLALDAVKLRDPGQRDAHLQALLESPFDWVEVSQEIKQRDMPLLPHPFDDPPQNQAAIVLIEPVGGLCARLALLHQSGESVSDVMRDYLRIENQPISGMQSPPGVLPVRARWKNAS